MIMLDLLLSWDAPGGIASKLFVYIVEKFPKSEADLRALEQKLNPIYPNCYIANWRQIEA